MLCCNAGIMLQPDAPSVDGYDVTMATNVLSHFLLVRELYPALEKTAAATSGRCEARVVTMSSCSGAGPPGFDQTFYAAGSGGNLGGGSMEQSFMRYHHSKLGNLLFTAALDTKLREAGSSVKALVCNPGVCSTDMLVHASSHFSPGKPADLSTVPSVEDGSLAQLKCICDPDVQSGEYWGWVGAGVKGENCGVLPMRIALEPPAAFVDEASKAALWAACEAAVGVFEV